jgi:ABC-type glycerol-3-phosphate transport system substrate-binding protein
MLPVWIMTYELQPWPGTTIIKHITNELPPPEWTWEEAVEWFENEMEINEADFFLGFPASFLLVDLITQNSYYFYDPVTETVDYDSPVLHEIINVVKRLYDDNRLNGLDYETGFLLNNEAKALMFYYTFGDHVTDFTEMIVGDSRYYPAPVIPGTDGKDAYIESTFGINAASSMSAKAAAWEFIKILLSDEIQNGDLFWSGASPVLSDLNKEGVVRIRNGPYYMDNLSSEELNRHIEAVTDEELVAFNENRRAYYDKLNRLSYFPDSMDYNVITSNAKLFLANQISFEKFVENMKGGWLGGTVESDR